MNAWSWYGTGRSGDWTAGLDSLQHVMNAWWLARCHTCMPQLYYPHGAGPEWGVDRLLHGKSHACLQLYCLYAQIGACPECGSRAQVRTAGQDLERIG